jgi:hypothetical protein
MWRSPQLGFGPQIEKGLKRWHVDFDVDLPGLQLLLVRVGEAVYANRCPYVFRDPS